LIFVDSKALKWAHSKSYVTISATQSIGKNQPIENRIRDRTKYITKARSIVGK
jgi:hypothetical protein